jgi:hypothetical protein
MIAALNDQGHCGFGCGGRPRLIGAGKNRELQNTRLLCGTFFDPDIS